MDQAGLLNALAWALGTPTKKASDYRISKELGLSRQHISMVRSGTANLGEGAALKLAQLADLHPGYVLTVIAASKAKTPEAKSTWEKAARTLAGLTVALVAGISIFSNLDHQLGPDLLAAIDGSIPGSQILTSTGPTASAPGLYIMLSFLLWQFWLAGQALRRNP